MITINTISPTRFSFNGVTYHKNFMPFVTGNKIAIINVYDGCITLTDAPTIFSDYTVNGVTYGSVNDLQSALLDVIYTRNSLTNAAITLTTTGNSGAATLTGITLNIPNYTLAGLGGVGGTGATNFLPKFTGGSTIGNSLIFDNGTNVGIGTTSPTERLTVSGNLKLSGTSPYIDLNSSGWSGSAYIQTNINLAQNAAGDYFSFQNLAGKGFAFQRGTTTDMLINPSGNVGIGTTSPANLLTLKASVVAPIIDINRSGGGQGKNSGILFRDQVNNEQAAIGTEGQNTNDLQLLSTTAIRFYTSSDLVLSNERMRITSSGNVGIGTTSPSGKLTIDAGAASSTLSTLSLTQGASPYGQITGAGDASHGLILRGYPSNGTTYDYSVTVGDVMSFYDFGGEFRFYKKNGSLAEQMRITSSGNVGIGTTSPAQRLDVNGLINSTNGISVGGEGVSRFWTGTQAAYDAITTKVSTTVYLIT
jgi:hypothetical protein